VVLDVPSPERLTCPGSLRSSYSEEVELVRIPDELRECVCFVQASWASGNPGMGTAFFVGTPLAGLEGHWYYYAITAKHVISDVERGPAETAALLLNKREGGRAIASTRVSDWLIHETADVAVLPIGSLNPEFQVTVWDIAESAATNVLALPAIFP
jgi:hypothetical protein